MRITKARLRQIIREELELALETEEAEENTPITEEEEEGEEGDAVNEAEEEEDKELNERLRKALLKYLGK